MERWGLHFPQLDARSHFNMTLNTSAIRETPWTAQNTTRAIIADLKLAQVQTLRTMHLTLGAFSLALSLLTVHRIISDARRIASVQTPLRKKRFSSLQSVHPAETFPLVLACGAVIQQIIFVAVQSTSLRSVLSKNCRAMAMITYPAIFLLGYVTLAFGIEMALRAFKRQRFAPRGKWNSPICLGAIFALLLATWMPTIAWPMFNRCFGSLIWFTVRYELISICILSILVFSFLLLAALISIQLMRTTDVDHNERIAASRMCYYLLMVTVVYVMVIPVEIQAHRRDFMNTLATSRIAEISLFTSGIVVAFFHLFLRVNATRLVIKPLGEMKAPSAQKRPRIRFFGPSDLEMNISGPIALQGGRRPDSRQGLIDVGPEKNLSDFDADYFLRANRPLSPGSMTSQGIDPSKWPLPPYPTSEDKEMSQGHKRVKSNYSLFPTRAEEIPRLPATVYSPSKPAGESRFSKLAVRRQTRRSSLGDAKSVTDVSEAFSFNFLTKPPPLFAGRHRRDESTDSSATVQIGLRFSVAPATLAAAKCTKAERLPSSALGAPPLRRDYSESSLETIESLNLPIQSPSIHSAPIQSPSSGYLSGENTLVNFPEPPHTMSPTRVFSPAKPSPGRTPAFPILSQDKLLPPTPRSAFTGAPEPVLPMAAFSGLRMNPISPASLPRSASPAISTTSTSRNGATRSPTTRSPTARSPTARSPIAGSPTAWVPLGAGTMARSPPPNGWI
ncbi:hypothetical protein K505DRAFT_259881 [Melanomma pulvis-pyrius CBS 109.77]|uniref:Uncharacterized protein n=1 Tax=Melanomma pulvis-pyrius CBS 109.77 TaxID=1314802 RepID=A0A6A6WR96_9PLEO|nr:hypothetical protein K505DRAFT_259881 [Melanomma pulvis-pyrius CBS 109.77]